MKIKVKDLTDDLVEKIDSFYCLEECDKCSFCDEKLMFLNSKCVCNFIRTLKHQQHLQDYEIDISSLSTEKYSSVIEMCEGLDLDKNFISDLKESIQKKEEVQKDLKIVFKYLKDSSACLEVMKSFENVENYLENN